MSAAACIADGIDLDQARRFLQALDPEAESFTFQTFDDVEIAGKKRKSKALAKVLSGTLDDVAPQLQALNARGAGVFVTVNETDGKGRKGANILRVRAIWQEDDGEGLPLPLEPHIEVATSPGKRHRYILVDGLSTDEHAQTMARIVGDYGSDPNAADLARVLRVPGFFHSKGAPHLVRLVQAEQSQPYTRERVLSAFPAPTPTKPSPVASIGSATEFADEKTIADLRSALNAMRSDERADWIRQGARLRSLGDIGRGLWLDWSSTSGKFDLGDAAREWDTIGHDRTGYRAIFTEAQSPRWGWVNPLKGSAGASESEADRRARASDARKATSAPTSAVILPALPGDLLSLPGGLGELQAWILGYMTYPSPAAAGVTALAVLAHFAMGHVKIDSRDALGLNEQYLLLAPTGFGKEDLRKPFGKLAAALLTCPRPANAGNLWPPMSLPKLQYSAPASQQGLHRLLEAHRSQTFLADEFAEWLGHAASDSHKQQALGYIMQAYSKAFDTLAAPAIAAKESKDQYQPVECPRVLIFATSTAERILETINSSQADSGALNRFVILVTEQDRIAKRYDVKAVDYAPPAGVVELIAWVASLSGDTVVSFDSGALDLYRKHDSAVLDPLKFSDARLAGRLNEQAFKMAALIALSDRRLVIAVRDLAMAYAIREGLYHRACSLIGHDGALSGMHPTTRAFEQLRNKFERSPFLYRANLPKESRQFAKLAIHEQQAVQKELQVQGVARVDGGKFVSLIHQEAA